MAKKKWDSDWVHFSKRARRGIIVLLIVFVIVAVSPRLYYNYVHVPPEYEIQIRPLEKIKEEKEKIKVNSIESKRYSQPKEMFNPNDYTLDEWKDVGLSEKQASSILKYLSSGATLKVKSDLKKLYVVDQELYDLLEPKIDLPDKLEKWDNNKYANNKSENNYNEENTINSKNASSKVIAPVSVNSATVSELKRIPGIGDFYAEEIIKLREAYGGFISHNQLLEIFDMTEERIDSLKPYLIINKNQVRKLNINSATEQELRAHHLISYDMAKSIVYFRENYRIYKRIDEILLSPYIDREKLKTLEPYLKVE